MTRLRRLRRHPVLLLWLTAVWVGLWGSPSAANVAGGVATAVVLLLILPLPDAGPTGRVRPLALIRYAVFFVGELVKASVVVVVQVLHPRRRLQQAVLTVDAAGASDRLLTMIANSISLTPGTLSLHVDRERSLIYVHALDVGGTGGVEGARRSLQRLVRLAVRAGGTPEHLRRLEEPDRGREVSS